MRGETGEATVASSDYPTQGVWYFSSAMTVTPATSSISTTDAARVLASHGYRATSPRQAVLEVVLGHERPFTAEQIVAELPETGRATVYRTLEILASVDILTRVLQAGGHPAYIVGTPGHRHHLVCSACGVVVAFTDCPIEALISQLSSDTAFSIQGHHLEVFGVCPDCQPGSLRERSSIGFPPSL